MSWPLVVSAAGAALLIALLASTSVRLARTARLEQWQAALNHLDSWRERIDQQFVACPALIALYDEYDDLRASDSHTRARLRVLALMHLDLLQTALDLIDGLGPREARRVAPQRDRWERYIRAVYLGSSVVRAALAEEGGRYAPDLAARLREVIDTEAPPRAEP